MSDGVKIKITEDVTPTLREMAKRGRDFRPIMPALAVVGLDSIQENFQQEGRPEKWKPLKIPTGNKILHGKSPRLRSSIGARFNATELELGTNLVYAAAHDEGFDKTVQVRAHTRRIRQAFGRAIGETTVSVSAHSRHMVIPQRKFMIVADEDLDEMARTAADYFVPKMKG